MQRDGGDDGGGKDPLRNSYVEWTADQIVNHIELEHTLILFSTTNSDTNNTPFREAVVHSLQLYEDYAQRPRSLLREDAHWSLDLICGSWYNSFECAFMWLGGCRPSSALRLTYSISGSELEARPFDLVAGPGHGAAAFVLTACQLELIDTLHHRTVTEEDQLMTMMAMLQEDVDDKLLLISANKHCDMALCS